MRLNGTEWQASKPAISDTCPRPTTQEIQSFLAEEAGPAPPASGQPASRGGAGAASVSGIDLRSALAEAPAASGEEEEEDEDGVVADFLKGL
jgi:hypothetical protein